MERSYNRLCHRQFCLPAIILMLCTQSSQGFVFTQCKVPQHLFSIR